MLVSVIGGDLRQITLAFLLKKEGYDVKIFGFDKQIDTKNLKKAKNEEDAARAEIVILPLPVSHDGVLLNSPFCENEIKLSSLFEKISSDTIIFGGKLTPNDILQKRNIKTYDYLEREELSVANAIPTAEGAIEIALSETPHTLHKSSCLVVGYGRIGKILADRLKAFGADVTVSARKCADFAWCDANGVKCVHSNALSETIKNYQVIFNTVPSVIFDEKLLKEIEENTLIIDLASKPGGVDFSLAKDLGIKVIWALSLPGKVAPITSGEIIKNTIINILREKGGKIYGAF